MKLKATDLMVGDWVHVPMLCDVVEGDTGNMRIKQLHIADCDCESFKELSYDEIEPLPITKDVLSAHHFSYHPTQHYCEKDFGDINVHIQLACGGGVEYCRIKRRYNSAVWTCEHDEILLTDIRYVHQLQHALNLIGADCGDTF